MMKLTKEEEELLKGILIDGNEIGAPIQHVDDHPQPAGTMIEQVLNIEPGSTQVQDSSAVVLHKIEAVTPTTYDEKDAEIDTMFQQVYDAAITSYAVISNELPNIEPKYRSRSGEVAATYLNTALAAAAHKLNQKKEKDKLVAAVNKPASGNVSTTIVNIGDLIKQMNDMNGPPTKSLNRNEVTVEPEDETDAPPTRKMKTS